MKPVGEPDALIGHVRFDERGWETGCCRMAQATALILDSTDSCRSGRADQCPRLGAERDQTWTCRYTSRSAWASRRSRSAADSPGMAAVLCRLPSFDAARRGKAESLPGARNGSMPAGLRDVTVCAAGWRSPARQSSCPSLFRPPQKTGNGSRHRSGRVRPRRYSPGAASTSG